MAIELDHLILPVNERESSVRFYTRIIGLGHDPDDGPFSVLRVTPNFTLLIAACGTDGGYHLAFAMPKPEFTAAFERIVSARVAYGDRFDAVGSQRGPADETGARGMGKTIYLLDPDKHLIELRHYDA
jgi:catechol 2,3-dioxygenase-like lactoylglutathione lyase family enzyme